MNKLFGVVQLAVFSAVLILGFAPRLYAQDQDAVDNGSLTNMGEDPGWQGDGGTDGWKDKFGLSDSQAGKLKDLFKKHRGETQAVVDQIKIDLDTLKLKVDTKASDDQVQALLDALKADQKKFRAQTDAFTDQLKPILTPTQRAKFLLAVMEHWKWGRGMMGHPGMEKGKWKHKESKAAGSPSDAEPTPGGSNP
jgi:Spy/CpxP family protein refolding chaperone